MRKIASMMLFIVVLVLVQKYGAGDSGQQNVHSERQDRALEKWRQRQADSIREAVFRVLLKETRKGSVAFIEIEDHDPTPKLLSRLQRYRAAVVPVSRNDKARIVGQSGVVDVHPRDKKTGGDGEIMRFERIVWVDRTHADMRAGRWSGLEESSSAIYRLQWSGGHWTITGTRDYTVS